MSKRQFGLYSPRNAERYRNKKLPPAPPPKTARKAQYHTRGRLRSVTRATSRRDDASQMNEDDAKSMIYDTQQFDIVYEPSDTALYDASVDVYSFGVILWESALCDRIYNEMDMKAIRDMVCEGRRMRVPRHSECAQ